MKNKLKHGDIVNIIKEGFRSPSNYGRVGGEHHWDNCYWIDIISSGERCVLKRNELLLAKGETRKDIAKIKATGRSSY